MSFGFVENVGPADESIAGGRHFPALGAEFIVILEEIGEIENHRAGPGLRCRAPSKGETGLVENEDAADRLIGFGIFDALQISLGCRSRPVVAQDQGVSIRRRQMADRLREGDFALARDIVAERKFAGRLKGPIAMRSGRLLGWHAMRAMQAIDLREMKVERFAKNGARFGANGLQFDDFRGHS